MKPRHLAIIAAFTLIAWSMTSCVTTRTTITAPDGTVTVTETSGPDAASVALAADAVAVAAATQIHPTK